MGPVRNVVVAALALTWLCLPVGAAVPRYPCFRPTVAPVIDGEVAGDPAWANIPAVTGFSVLGGGYTEAKQTVAQACWDDEALYVAMVCEEPDAAHLRKKMNDGGPFWEEDSIELFLQPVARGQVYQLGITAFGAKGGHEGAPDITKFQAAAKRGEDFYSLEVRVPHEVVGAKPKAGDEWRGNFCRNIYAVQSGGDKFTCWAPLKRQFLEPANFAVIALEGPAPEAAKAQAIADRLNAGYRQHMARRLTTVASRSTEYEPVLAEAASDPEFGQRATALRDRWSALRHLAQQAGRAQMAELRQILASADELLKASYELKYAYLIAKLLRE